MKKEKQEKLRVIPKGNYVKLAIMIIITVAIVIFAFVLYDSQKKYISKIPVIRNTVAEITESDIHNYFHENDDFLLYVGVADDMNCRKLEEDIIELRKTRNLTNLVYLNLTDSNNRGEFYNVFNSNYGNGKKLKSYPAFLIISNGKVVELVQREDRKLSIDDIVQLLDEYEINGDLS